MGDPPMPFWHRQKNSQQIPKEGDEYEDEADYANIRPDRRLYPTAGRPSIAARGQRQGSQVGYSQQAQRRDSAQRGSQQYYPSYGEREVRYSQDPRRQSYQSNCAQNEPGYSMSDMTQDPRRRSYQSSPIQNQPRYSLSGMSYDPYQPRLSQTQHPQYDQPHSQPGQSQYNQNPHLHSQYSQTQDQYQSLQPNLWGSRGEPDLEFRTRAPIPSVHREIPEGLDDFQRARELHHYVDDSGQYPNENTQDYLTRMRRATENMSIEHNVVPTPAFVNEPNLPQSTINVLLRRHLLSLLPEYDEHHARITEGLPTYDMNYAIDFYRKKEEREGRNRARRATALELKRQLDAINNIPPCRTPDEPENTGTDLYTWAINGPLPRGWHPLRELTDRGFTLPRPGEVEEEQFDDLGMPMIPELGLSPGFFDSPNTRARRAAQAAADRFQQGLNSRGDREHRIQQQNYGPPPNAEGFNLPPPPGGWGPNGMPLNNPYPNPPQRQYQAPYHNPYQSPYHNPYQNDANLPDRGTYPQPDDDQEPDGKTKLPKKKAYKVTKTYKSKNPLPPNAKPLPDGPASYSTRRCARCAKLRRACSLLDNPVLPCAHCVKCKVGHECTWEICKHHAWKPERLGVERNQYGFHGNQRGRKKLKDLAPKDRKKYRKDKDGNAGDAGGAGSMNLRGGDFQGSFVNQALEGDIDPSADSSELSSLDEDIQDPYENDSVLVKANPSPPGKRPRKPPLRKSRPTAKGNIWGRRCIWCKRDKKHCNLGENGPPCQNCMDKNRNCEEDHDYMKKTKNIATGDQGAKDANGDVEVGDMNNPAADTVAGSSRARRRHRDDDDASNTDDDMPPSKRRGRSGYTARLPSTLTGDLARGAQQGSVVRGDGLDPQSALPSAAAPALDHSHSPQPASSLPQLHSHHEVSTISPPNVNPAGDNTGVEADAPASRNEEDKGPCDRCRFEHLRCDGNETCENCRDSRNFCVRSSNPNRVANQRRENDRQVQEANQDRPRLPNLWAVSSEVVPSHGILPISRPPSPYVAVSTLGLPPGRLPIPPPVVSFAAIQRYNNQQEAESRANTERRAQAALEQGFNIPKHSSNESNASNYQHTLYGYLPNVEGDLRREFPIPIEADNPTLEQLEEMPKGSPFKDLGIPEPNASGFRLGASTTAHPNAPQNAPCDEYDKIHKPKRCGKCPANPCMVMGHEAFCTCLKCKHALDLDLRTMPPQPENKVVDETKVFFCKSCADTQRQERRDARQNPKEIVPGLQLCRCVWQLQKGWLCNGHRWNALRLLQRRVLGVREFLRTKAKKDLDFCGECEVARGNRGSGAWVCLSCRQKVVTWF